MDIPNNKKSEMIQILIGQDNVDSFKDGGKTKDKVESAAEKISRLMEEVIKPAAEAGNKTALRFLDVDKNFYTFTEEDKAKGSREEPGSRGNVYVASDPNSKYMIPTIQYRNGNLTFIGTDFDFNDPEVLEQAIEFATPEDANFFAENYHNYPELVPMLQNKQYDKDMTLDDILKLNISDSAKEEITKAFAEGGSVKQEVKKLNPAETITVGGQTFDVEIADTAEARKDGLSRVKRLAHDEGMLFVFEEPSTSYFTMADTDIDLDIIFFNEDGVALEVHSVEARSEEPVQCSQEYQYVLEINIDSDVQPGEELVFEEDSDFTEDERKQISRSKMLVLNSEGDVQMKLEGGERIVSMIKTRQLIKAALKAYRTDNDSDYRRVGKLIIQEFDAQDNREPQYTSK